MENLKSNLYPCAHCQQTGTCNMGNTSQACAVCVKKHELKNNQDTTGIPCGICGGIGFAEPTTERIYKRMPPALAFSLIFMLFSLIFFAMLHRSEYFTQILTFSSTLLGVILTFWFSKTKS